MVVCDEIAFIRLTGFVSGIEGTMKVRVDNAQLQQKHSKERR